MSNQILAVLKEGLSAWKVYISSRQEAYERKMDRNQKRTIAQAAVFFRRLYEIGYKIEDKELLKCKERFYKYRGRI